MGLRKSLPYISRKQIKTKYFLSNEEEVTQNYPYTQLACFSLGGFVGLTGKQSTFLNTCLLTNL